jgi:hypothetical protein
MAPLGHLAKRIMIHRIRAKRLQGLARRRHFRAAVLARKALVANQRGHRLRALNLLRGALRVKAAAARAAFRSRVNRQLIVRVRRLRRLRAQKRRARF